MKQKTLAVLMKIAVVLMGVVGVVCFADLIPVMGKDIVLKYPEFDYFYLPWLIFLEILAIPYFFVMVLGWLVASEISKDNSFSFVNAKRIKMAAIATMSASIYFFAGNIVLALASLSHPGVLLASFIVDFIGVAFSIGFAMLSHLILKAAELQKQNDLTI